MKKRALFSTYFVLLFSTLTYSQVKIGDNPSSIHSSSILELESSNKVLVISRMSTAQIAAVLDPQAGSLVYNTDQNCVFMHDGTSWRSLCNTITGINVTNGSTAPSAPNLGDFWINETQNDATRIWNGTRWVLINNNPKRGNGAPNATNTPSPSAGDIYVDSITGSMYAYDGTTWVQSGGKITANNGLLLTPSNTVQLGGALIQPTIITTNATNTLAVKGLEKGDITKDDIVTINRTTGQLRKVTTNSLFREKITTITAQDGDRQFNPILPINDPQKTNVYRNGVRIDFTVVNATTLEIEKEATCYAGDEIRIVQFY